MAAKKQMVSVSQRALIQRINRILAKRGGAPGELLRAARGTRARQDLGDYYVVDLLHNRVINTNVDLEEFGREVEALAPYESLENEGGR
jgi:hypothetical protein